MVSWQSGPMQEPAKLYSRGFKSHRYLLFCPNNFDHPKRPVYGLFCFGFFQTTHIMKVQHIYTDGSCLGNPGPWWWAYLITDGDSIIVQNAGPISQTTNNQMELYACIQALQYIVDHGLHHSLWVCHTDSRYIQDWLTYLTRWKQYGWKTRNRQMVKNQMLWKTLDTLCQQCQLDRQWVKAHHNNEHNNTVDKAARQESKIAQTNHLYRYDLDKSLQDIVNPDWLFGWPMDTTRIT